MQTMNELTELLTQPEGKTLEYKRDLSSPHRVLHSVVAFANTAGGTLVLGVLYSVGNYYPCCVVVSCKTDKAYTMRPPAEH